MSASAGTELAVEGLTIRFGGLTAVDGIAFEVRSGEVLSLIGPNGAGKTTAFNAITGYIEPAAGEIRYRATQHALDMGRRQNLADHVEDRVVVERVANLLELLVQPLKDPALDRVCGHEVEDQAVLALAVAVDAAHPLLETVRVPGDVVVEEDVADLEVDAFAEAVSSDENTPLSSPLARID